jgi:hypothetical protein
MYKRFSIQSMVVLSLVDSRFNDFLSVILVSSCVHCAVDGRKLSTWDLMSGEEMQNEEIIGVLQ